MTSCRTFAISLASKILGDAKCVSIAVHYRRSSCFDCSHSCSSVCRYLARVTDVEATDTSNPYLNYGIVVDCGSSGSRVFVYCWPRHNGNPHDLLDIKQMRDKNRKPVVMKIKPGKSSGVQSSRSAQLHARGVMQPAQDCCIRNSTAALEAQSATAFQSILGNIRGIENTKVSTLAEA